MKVVEGSATITVPNNVFYNPKMSKLRDMSVMLLKAAGARGISMLDSTSATGIRGIRYALEAGVGDATFLDINKAAYSSTKANLKANKVAGRALNDDVRRFASTANETYGIIDLDPFGSPAPYIYDVMKLAADGTLLMITATDTAVLCGAHPAACVKSYGAKPLHSELCQEAGTRILIGFVLRNAMQFNFGIEPLLGVADMHYMRVFLRLKGGAAAANLSSKELGFGTFCVKCGNFECKKGIAPKLEKKCAYCGAPLESFGPLWLGRLFNKQVLAGMLKDGVAYPVAGTLVHKMHSELDVPFFYSIPKLTKRLGIGSVSPVRVMDELKSSGYLTSFTHFRMDSIKTDAVIENVARAVKKITVCRRSSSR